MATLYIVATPIGNLSDMTPRAVSTLQEVDLVYAEDTREARKLFDRFEVNTPVLSLHERSGDSTYAKAVEALKEGKNVAFISDAGTPGVSDPGGKLVAAARGIGATVIAIPGASALTAAMSVCGFPTQQTVFMGFPPNKKGRETFFKHIAQTEMTVVFYESVHRIDKAMASLKKYADSDREVVICRELTKKHESVDWYRLGDLDPASIVKKGEFVVVLAPIGWTSYL